VLPAALAAQALDLALAAQVLDLALAAQVLDLAQVPPEAPALVQEQMVQARVPKGVLVLAHLVVEAAVLLQLLLSRQSFSAAMARSTP
jgi:hypothetical protein